MATTDRAGADWVVSAYRDAVPAPGTGSAVEWCERHVALPGSAKNPRFDSSITPWIREPIEMAATGAASTVTLIKPVQAGGSVAGECCICYWIAQENSGDVQYNWPHDSKAANRWDKRFEKILTACAPVMAKAPSRERHVGRWSKGQIIFPTQNFTMQGISAADNLDSDSVRFMVNEELHAWDPGRLAKAYGRTTAVWNACVLNISNASSQGSQLHQAQQSGTNQEWEVPCPSCGQFHAMRSFFDRRNPQLGGLRYDADGCRLGEGWYDYNRLEATIHYQFPCGHTMRDIPTLRQELAARGRYGDPRNRGASLTDRSYSLEAVAIPYIRWLTLIKEKHSARRSLADGDPEPWWRYLAERECRFYDVMKDRPSVARVVAVTKTRRLREGLEGRVARIGALDRQRGRTAQGEVPHWWGLIRDVDESGSSLLVYEGRIETDEDAVNIMREHGVRPSSVVVDSGWNAASVYAFCLAHGFNAIKGSSEAGFAHEDGIRKIFSREKPLHTIISVAPTCEDPADEPMFWLYSKAGIRDRLSYLRASQTAPWLVPDGCSQHYHDHMQAEELQERRDPATGELTARWVQVKDRNDLYVLECYVAMVIEMAGLLPGADAAPPVQEESAANERG